MPRVQPKAMPNFNVALPLADYVLGTNIRASRSDLKGMYRLRLL